MCLDEEGVLHVAGGVVFGEVHRREHVPVVLHLGTIGQGEAHAGEDVDDLVLHDGERVACAQLYGVGRTGEVHLGSTAVVGLEGLFEFGDALCSAGLQCVESHAHLFLLLGRHVTEVGHQVIDGALLAQILDAQCFQLFCAIGGEGFDLSHECFYLAYHNDICCFFELICKVSAR